MAKVYCGLVSCRIEQQQSVPAEHSQCISVARCRKLHLIPVRPTAEMVSALVINLPCLRTSEAAAEVELMAAANNDIELWENVFLRP